MAAPTDDDKRMPVETALQVLATLRADRDVVITNQGSARLWPRLSTHVGDLNYNPSTMGGAIPLALGIALACPQRQVIVVSGDGSLLMNLACLVTVVDSRADNLSVVLLDNARYEVTGGQAIAAAPAGTDFAGIAQATGFATVAVYGCERQWQAAAADFFRKPGPRFVSLQVAPMQIDCLNDTTEPIGEQLQRLTNFLQSTGERS